jgi:hypothetical protein
MSISDLFTVFAPLCHVWRHAHRAGSEPDRGRAHGLGNRAGHGGKAGQRRVDPRHPITVEEARELGLPVSTDMPQEVYDLMQLYPQAAQRRPSVQYIPIPYRREGPKGSSSNVK